MTREQLFWQEKVYKINPSNDWLTDLKKKVTQKKGNGAFGSDLIDSNRNQLLTCSHF